MFTTARLAVDDWRTSVRLTGDDWQPGQPSDQFDVVWVDMDDWRPGADAELAARGFTRLDGWKYEPIRDVYVAAITTA